MLVNGCFRYCFTGQDSPDKVALLRGIMYDVRACFVARQAEKHTVERASC
jgi:hypothetical protein